MALRNAFGNLALDQSVMSTTPLLKAINTTLLSTPYVFVANYPANQTQNVLVTNPSTPFGVQNVNIANVSTPPAIQPVSLASTPIVYSYQPSPYFVQGTVGVSNFPGIQSVSITSTPIVYSYQPSPYAVYGNVGITGNVNIGNFPAIQNVAITSTPIVYAYQGNAAYNVAVANWGSQVFATPLFVDIVGQTTPLSVFVVNQSSAASNVNITSTPIVYSYQPSPYFIQGSVSVSNFPATQNVAITSTPISYVYQGQANWNVAVQNFPLGFNVNNWASQLFPTPLYVDIVGQTTPLQVSVNNFPVTQNVAVTSTPIVYSYQPSPYFVQGTVSVGNFPATQNVAITSTPISYVYQGPANWNVAVQNFPTGFNVNNWASQLFPTPLYVNIVGQSTPLQTTLQSTPITYAYQPYPYTVQGTVSVGNFPATQNVAITSTPYVYAYQPYPYFVQGNVGITGNVTIGNLPYIQKVDFLQQSTPLQVTIIGPSTPVVKITPDASNMGPQGTQKVQAVFVPGQITTDLTNNFQGSTNIPINLYNSAAGNQATPLVLAGSKQIKVLGYAFTTSSAATVIFTATPLTRVPSLQLADQVGVPNALTQSYALGGPFVLAQNGGISFAGSLIGEAFTVPAATPLYIQSSGSNVGGHLVYVLL